MNNSQIKVLIAEDDEQFRSLLERFLSPNYQVLTAGNGEEAFAIAKKENPDILLTDVIMPKKTGVELLSEMRKDDVTKNIPVVILLATAFKTDIDAARTLGAAAILPKEDVTIKSLQETISSLVKNK